MPTGTNFRRQSAYLATYVRISVVMSGVDLRTVQELGGWRTLAMIERYSHLSPQHKARVIERLAEFPFTHAGAVEKTKFSDPNGRPAANAPQTT